MEQHPIPQHIASFQFKLFGNLTTRQFVTLAIPLSLATLVFFSGLPTLIRLPLSLVIGIFSFVIALVPIGGKPFHQWVVAFVKAILSPTQRIWIKEKQIPAFLALVITPPQAEETLAEIDKTASKEKLLAYIKSLPKEKLSGLDVKELQAIQRLGLEEVPASETQVGEKNMSRPIIWPSENTSFVTNYNYRMSVPQNLAKVAAPVSPLAYNQPALQVAREVKVAASAKPFILQGVERKLSAKIQKPPQRSKVIKASIKLASDTNYSIENIIPIRIPNETIKFLHGIGQTKMRKLHFAPPPGFDLSKLPIRGERRFEISEELKKRFQKEEGLPKIAESKQKTAATPPSAEKPKISYRTQVFVNPISKTYKPPRPQINPQQAAQSAPQKPPAQFALSYQKPAPTQTNTASSASIIPLTDTPNVISGQVTNALGIPQEGVVLVVHDTNNIPVRALKTSKLGQFLSATPLSDGAYIIEIESETAKFKPVTINLKGEALPPLAIVAERT